MHNEHLPTSIQERVQSAIQAGELKARPRAVFVVQIAAAGISALLALAAAVLALSFILYSVLESGEAFLLGFGQEGVALFLMLFPWLPALAALLLIAVFQWSLSYVVPSYRVPLIPLFGLLIVGIVGMGFLFVPFHASFSERIDDKNNPVLDELYESIYESREGYGLYRGTIVSIQSGGFRFTRSDGDADEDDQPRLVVPYNGIGSFRVGEEVFIFGYQQEGIIYAKHIVAFPDSD